MYCEIRGTIKYDYSYTENKNKWHPWRAIGLGTTFCGSCHSPLTQPRARPQRGQASLRLHQALSTAGRVTPPHSLLHGFRSRWPPRRPRRLLTHPSLSGIILPQCEGESLCIFFSVKLPRHGPFARPPSQNPDIYQSPQHISGCSECITRQRTEFSRQTPWPPSQDSE